MFRTLVFLAAVLAIGCSYSFRGQTAGAIKSLAIPTFENESTEFGISETITEALIRGFQRDGTLKISGEQQADAILRGRILRVEDQPYSARTAESVDEYRFAMTCEIELVDAKSQETLWTQNFPVWAIYPYAGSLEHRDEAIQEAVGKLLENVLNRIVGSW